MLVLNKISVLGLFAQFENDLESDLMSLSWKAVGIGTACLVVLILVATFTKSRWPKLNKALFGMIVLSVIVPTVTLIGSTIYLNVVSYAGGPVHWHADFETWVCGNEIELRDPTGALSNKIGTPVLHEHDDKRIHLEGVPITEKDATLGKFFYVIGGEMTDSKLVIPVNDEQIFEEDYDGDGRFDQYHRYVDGNYIVSGADGQYLQVENRDTCDTGEGELQVFAYRMSGDKTFKQIKVEDPANFVIKDDSNVPPGDCVIFDFDEPKAFTDKICAQYGIRDKNRCSQFGVESDQKGICELTDETDYDKLQQDFDKENSSEETDV